MKSGNQQVQSDWVYIYIVAIKAMVAAFRVATKDPGTVRTIAGWTYSSLLGLFTSDIMCGVDGGHKPREWWGPAERHRPRGSHVCGFCRGSFHCHLLK